MASSAEVVQGFMAAMGKGDFVAASKFLDPHLSFTGPIEHFDKAESYLESLKKLHPIIERVEMRKLFVDGADVCMLYDMVTRTPAGTAFIAEWHHVKDGRISEIHVVFDARPFAAMFAKH